MKRYLSYLILILLGVSCTTTRTVVSKNANLKNYEYVTITSDRDHPVPSEFMEHEISLFDAIEGVGLQLVNENRIYTLKSAEQEKLLMAKVGVKQLDSEQIEVTVSMVDYNTGRPLVMTTAIGKSRKPARAMRSAVQTVCNEIDKKFPRR